MKLYGKGGRTFRCLWMLREAGLDFEQIPIDWAAGESRRSHFLQINPNGKVPVLLDGELTLFESLAINYHLARCHARELWVIGEQAESQALQWLAWGMGELEGPHDAANVSQQPIDTARLQTSLNALRNAVAWQPYMMGGQFSVVDLNTACLLLRPQYRKVALHDDVLGEWFRACTHRPALAQVMTSS